MYNGLTKPGPSRRCLEEAVLVHGCGREPDLRRRVEVDLQKIS